MNAPAQNWFEVANVAEIDSPSLLLYPDRIRENIRRMIQITGGVARLCPHVKTHKLPEVMRLQIEAGITKFKSATIAETEMVAASGAGEVILAHQLVGPKVPRLIELIRRFPKTRFCTIADDEGALRGLSAAASAAGVTLPVFIDINCGMNRSGIPAGPAAFNLYKLLTTLPGLKAEGLHVYDGHIVDLDLAERTRKCQAAVAPTFTLKADLEKAGLPVPRVVGGGSPTFTIHAANPAIECSPGTTLLWDGGYLTQCPDIPLEPAAILLTRAISKPAPGRVCFDLGHKAVASEMPHPRVFFQNLPDAKAVMHSEEHLVIETAQADQIQVGQAFYVIPWHICPTVALHAAAVIIENGRATGRWKIVARARQIEV